MDFVTDVTINIFKEKHLNLIILYQFYPILMYGGRRKFMKKKIVGIFVCMLLITTAVPVVGTINNEKNNPVRFSLNDNYGKSQSTLSTINTIDRGAIFSQAPENPDKNWDGYFSDADIEWRGYEDFWNITTPICDIHWWGFGAIWNGTHWNNCDPSAMVFDITFYNDDGSGKPGDEVCSYKDIKPKINATGIFYDMPSVSPLELHYFQYNLDPCCQLSNGWVSVFKVSNPNECYFAWMVSPDGNWKFWQQNITANLWYSPWWNLAFILTDGEPIITELECFGSLIWEDVIPEDYVTGMFQIRNNGEIGSVIHWKINSSKLPWGTIDDWRFAPNIGILTTSLDWINVFVNVTAPNKKNKKYEGTIIVENILDPTDYCEITVKLITLKNKPYHLNQLFQRFLTYYPNLFPILRQLLGL